MSAVFGSEAGLCCQVLDEGTVECDVEHLHSPADGERRHSLAAARRATANSNSSPAGSRRRTPLRGSPAVLRGAHITSSLQQQTIDAVEDSIDIFGLERDEDQRDATGDMDHVRIGRVDDVCSHPAATGQSDDGAHGSGGYVVCVSRECGPTCVVRDREDGWVRSSRSGARR